MIHVQKENHTINHLCAVGYVLKSGDHEVVVLWREAGLLLRWWGGGGNIEEVKNFGFYYARTMLWSPKTGMDSLVEDRTVPLGNGSITYRENAEGTIADCEKHGKQYVIEPFMPPPRDD